MSTMAKSASLFLIIAAAGCFAQQFQPLTVAYQATHSVNGDVTLSPDGKQMIIVSEIAGKEQFVRMDLDGSHPVQLTRDEADHEDPAWSPDGKKVAFVLIQGQSEQVHLMNADGTGVEPLAPADVRTIHPSWSPDGKLVAYCTDDDLKPPRKSPSDIYSIDVQMRKATRLISGGVNTYPVWSPDGKSMAFRRMVGETNSEVFVANADGSGAHNITNNEAFDGWPAWSPDGSRIAFASNRNRSYEIYTMDADGGNVRKLAASEGRATAPKWSADGKTIYFPNCYKNALAYDCQIYAARVEQPAK
jgi:TolB protein